MEKREIGNILRQVSRFVIKKYQKMLEILKISLLSIL